MNLTSIIRMRILLVCTLFFSIILNSQNSDDEFSDRKIDSSEVEVFQKTAIFTLGVFQPIINDDSNIGKGANGNLSFKLGGQLFVYKRFFVGGFFNSTYLDITDISFTGKYKRSYVTTSYLQFGYEFSVSKKLSFAASIAPIGYADYRNYIKKNRVNQQHDSAKVLIYETYLSYDVSDRFSIFIDYSYRTDTTNIRTASEIQSNFSKIKYHNFGIGLKFTINNGNFFSNL